MRLGEPVDKEGKIRRVHDTTYVGEPVVGFMIETPEGMYAITHRDDVKFCGGVDDAVNYIQNKWRRR